MRGFQVVTLQQDRTIASQQEEIESLKVELSEMKQAIYEMNPTSKVCQKTIGK